MKRSLAIIALVCGSLPGQLNAGCGVQCSNAYIAPAFVQTAYAVPVGVPVANPYIAQYQYTPQAQPVSVTVNLDTHAIASEVVNALNAPVNQPTPDGPPQPPQPPTSRLKQTPVPPRPEDPFAEPTPSGAVAANCLSCHSPGRNAQAVAKIDLTKQLTCEQRLACARAVLSEVMPKGKKLDAPTAGQVLTELVGQQ